MCFQWSANPSLFNLLWSLLSTITALARCRQCISASGFSRDAERFINRRWPASGRAHNRKCVRRHVAGSTLDFAMKVSERCLLRYVMFTLCCVAWGWNEVIEVSTVSCRHVVGHPSVSHYLRWNLKIWRKNTFCNIRKRRILICKFHTQQLAGIVKSRMSHCSAKAHLPHKMATATALDGTTLLVPRLYNLQVAPFSLICICYLYTGLSYLSPTLI